MSTSPSPKASRFVEDADRNTIEIIGIDKQKVGQVAAEIRNAAAARALQGQGHQDTAGGTIFRKEGKKK